MTTLSLTPSVSVGDAPIDVAQEMACFLDHSNGAGAVATFVGAVRGDDGVKTMTLEHYPGMTEKALTDIALSANQRWQTQAVRIAHRVGVLSVGDIIVFVAVATAHRQDAFAACHYIADFLKSRAPFWKQETIANGQKRWVEQRSEDEVAIDQWQRS